jgi:hypothetical protein
LFGGQHLGPCCALLLRRRLLIHSSASPAALLVVCAGLFSYDDSFIHRQPRAPHCLWNMRGSSQATTTRSNFWTALQQDKCLDISFTFLHLYFTFVRCDSAVDMIMPIDP